MPFEVESTTHRRGVSPAAYAGTLSRWVGFAPGSIRKVALEIGGMAQLMGRVGWSAVRRPRGYWLDVFDEMYKTLRQAWFAVVVAVFGFLIFMSIMAILFISTVGAEQLFGPLILLQSMRSFTVWINAMVVAGVVGAALTADLGARKIREELDALEVLGVDTTRSLVLPKVVSVTLMTGLLSIASLMITIVSAQIGGDYVGHLPASDFYSNLYITVTPVEVVSVVINSLFAGFIIGAVCCYKGVTAQGGPTGLGRAVNQAVVVSFVAIWVFQLFYNALVLSLFPDLGNLR